MVCGLSVVAMGRSFCLVTGMSDLSPLSRTTVAGPWQPGPEPADGVPEESNDTAKSLVRIGRIECHGIATTGSEGVAVLGSRLAARRAR